MRYLSWWLLAMLLCTPTSGQPTAEPVTETGGAAADTNRNEEASPHAMSDRELRAYEEVETVAAYAQTVLVGVATAVAIASLVFSFFWIWMGNQQRTAKRSYQVLSRLQRDLAKSWGALDQDFDSISEEESDTVPGERGGNELESGDPFMDKRQAELEDYDTLLLVADRLSLSMQEPKALVERYLRMTRFWRGRRDYKRSLLRVDRALELAPRSHTALVQKAITLSGAVADLRYRDWDPDDGLPPALTATQIDLLDEAHELLERSDRFRGKVSPESLQQDGFIADELGNYRLAIERYERALGLLEIEAATPRTERLEELIAYNLACSQCMMGLYPTALATLSTLVGKGPHLEDASTDPQLARLREGEWQKRFEELLEEDRALRRA